MIMASTLCLFKLPISFISPKHICAHSKPPILLNPPLPQLSISNKKSSIQIPYIFELTTQCTNLIPFLPLSAVAFAAVVDPQNAVAAGGEFGVLEGRTFSLIHPIIMASLFFYTLWAGYLGWQWRRVRTVQNEINELKKEVKPSPVTPDGTPVAVDAPPSSIQSKILQLTEERKELVKGSYRDRHFNAGSILLAFGVFEAIGGGVNTYFRAGKLFPGPHLFAGAAITALWAAAAALVPQMQKGNENARNLHIALNAANVLLFVWQIPTGIDILFKVFELTNWP